MNEFDIMKDNNYKLSSLLFEQVQKLTSPSSTEEEKDTIRMNAKAVSLLSKNFVQTVNAACKMNNCNYYIISE